MIALRTAANPGSRIVTTHLHTPLLFTSVSLWYVRSCARFPPLSDVCLYPRNRKRIFRGAVHTQQCNHPSPRPTPPLLNSRSDSSESPRLSGTLRGLVASSEDGGAFSTGVRWQVARSDAQRALRLAITLHRPL